MRLVLSILLPPLLVAAVGVGTCMGLGWDAHVKLLAAAALVALLASIAALLPLYIARNGAQPAVMQASLIGTMLHLFACAIAVAVASFASTKPGLPFTYWLLAFYWASLAGVASVYVKAVRKAPVEASVRVVPSA